MNGVQRFFGHLHTITRHRHMVIVHCAKAGILRQGLVHDLSKYSPAEFIPGVRYYIGNKSPNEGERDVMGYSRAWMHHKGRNKHHYEYWSDYSTVTKHYEPVDIPYRYLAEMFCDRLAASKNYKGKDYKQTDPLEYFSGRKPMRAANDRTRNELEKMLTILAEKGEDAAFSYIRRRLKEENIREKEDKKRRLKAYRGEQKR